MYYTLYLLRIIVFINIIFNVLFVLFVMLFLFISSSINTLSNSIFMPFIGNMCVCVCGFYFLIRIIKLFFIKFYINYKFLSMIITKISVYLYLLLDDVAFFRLCNLNRAMEILSWIYKWENSDCLHALSYLNALMVSWFQYTHRSPAILSRSNYPERTWALCILLIDFILWGFPLISLASVGGYYWLALYEMSQSIFQPANAWTCGTSSVLRDFA